MELLVGRHDLNDDGLISLEEYLQDPVMEFTSEETQLRRRRFVEQMDSDANGQADRREILTYLDPKHVGQSKEEAIRLMMLADLDEDGVLDWSEVKRRAQLFLDSKWFSPERAFHWDL